MIAWPRLVAVVLLLILALPAQAAMPDGVKVLRDVAYGAGQAAGHGRVSAGRVEPGREGGADHPDGAWRRLAHRRQAPSAGVFENKVARWVPKGFIFVSVNYPMVPESDPVEQADDIARALAAVQAAAPGWGGDPARVILMGHSAGAHLVSLLNADPSRAAKLGAKPWLGTVSLDSGALDVPAIMNRPPSRPLRRRVRRRSCAVGSRFADPSPDQGQSTLARRLLQHRRTSCGTNRDLCRQVAGARRRAETLAETLSHGEINSELGKPGAYTDAVEAFMASLDPSVAALLKP